jgi:hypothetical protein
MTRPPASIVRSSASTDLGHHRLRPSSNLWSLPSIVRSLSHRLSLADLQSKDQRELQPTPTYDFACCLVSGRRYQVDIVREPRYSRWLPSRSERYQEAISTLQQRCVLLATSATFVRCSRLCLDRCDLVESRRRRRREASNTKEGRVCQLVENRDVISGVKIST